jgi:hypothetical protein
LIYISICNQCLSPMTYHCKFESWKWWGVLDTTWCNKVCHT